jgi:hypothetical protein
MDMSKFRDDIKISLTNRGFTGEIKLFFWPKDGWYAHCDQFKHIWLGQHGKHSIEQINEGLFDEYLK